MKFYKKIRIVGLMLFLFIEMPLLAQYKNEIGLMGGGSFYMGDVNKTRLFYNIRPAYGILYKYNFTQRWVLGAQVTRATVAADSKDFKNVYPNHAEGAFKRDFWDANIRCEYNFYNYTKRKGSKAEKPFSPYIFAGVGLTAYNDDYKGSTQFGFNIPFGVGFRVKLHPLVNLGVEWSFAHLFRDDFDVVSEETKFLDNPYNVKKSAFKNNDWYSFAMLYLSFNVFDNKLKCW